MAPLPEDGLGGPGGSACWEGLQGPCSPSPAPSSTPRDPARILGSRGGGHRSASGPKFHPKGQQVRAGPRGQDRQGLLQSLESWPEEQPVRRRLGRDHQGVVGYSGRHPQ